MYKLNASTKEIKQIFSQLPTKYKMLYVGSQKDIYVLNENTWMASPLLFSFFLNTYL